MYYFRRRFTQLISHAHPWNPSTHILLDVSPRVNSSYESHPCHKHRHWLVTVTLSVEDFSTFYVLHSMIYVAIRNKKKNKVALHVVVGNDLKHIST